MACVRHQIWHLAAFEGRLFAGEEGGQVRIWDPATGTYEGALSGHTCAISALLVVGPRLVSGDGRGAVKVWSRAADRVREGPVATGAEGVERWGCERTEQMEGGGLLALAACGTPPRWICCGMCDGRIRVWAPWGAVDGGPVLGAELRGHTGMVRALAAHGERLYSASEDGTIRAWACGTWAALRTVEATGGGPGGPAGQFPYRLAVNGRQLVSGNVRRHADGGIADGDGLRECEVRVWDLETLALRHAVPAGRASPGDGVRCLVSSGRAVWGGVGAEAAVWGRE
jgi:WD40 repeat protein